MKLGSVIGKDTKAKLYNLALDAQAKRILPRIARHRTPQHQPPGKAA